MSYDTRADTALLGREREGTFGPQWTIGVLLAFVIVLDQATKWWAWRDAPTAHINFGGDPLVGSTVGGWYANPVTGALLDLLSAALLTVALQILLRRRLPTVIRVSAALAIGGWVSNLLDRLGMHYVTAPGSIRGAVDFIHIGDYYLNVADFFIVGATLVFLLAHGHRWSTARHARTTTPNAARRLRASARLVATTSAAGLVVAVALGAANYGGVIAPGSGL
jgi:lipoprotein signal peptidase